MNIRRVVTLWIIAILSYLPRVDAALGQTAPSSLPEAATAHIPYDFWVGGTHLPAGDYSVSPGPASVVVFWNEKGEVGEQAFLIPTGGPVGTGDYKLIFVVHNGEHRLRAIWYAEGKAVLTSEFDVPLQAGDTNIEVKLLEQRPTQEAVRTAQ